MATSSAAVAADIKTGGRLRVGHVGGGKGESFNPGRGSSFIDASRAYNMYDPLTRVNNDFSQSPGLALARQLRGLHADVVVYDPVALSGLNDKRGRGPWLVMARSALGAARRADALVVASEWPEFAALDLVALRETMRGAILVDGRGILDADAAGRAGFQFFTLDGVPARAAR